MECEIDLELLSLSDSMVDSEGDYLNDSGVDCDG